MEIAIIDYGAGNTTNVKNALAKLGVQTTVSSSQRDFADADALILPGVGAFGAAMSKLSPGTELVDTIKGGKPFLGICLGMQLLLESSEENDGVRGLAIIPGNVKRFQVGLPIPQMGWNIVEPNDEVEGSGLFEGLGRFYAYFVHSYYCCPESYSVIAATTVYGITFPSAFAKGNIYATQFHPEKSGERGLAVLANFIKVVRK